MENKEIPTLDEFLEDWAIKKGYKNWVHCCNGNSYVASERFKIAGHEYAVLFARHYVTEALNAASEKAQPYLDQNDNPMVSKGSILNSFDINKIK